MTRFDRPPMPVWLIEAGQATAARSEGPGFPRTGPRHHRPRTDRQHREFVDLWRQAGLEVRARPDTYCCPFHDDQKPSLSIDPARCLWRCHGTCNSGGGLRKLRERLGVARDNCPPDVAARLDAFQANVDREVTGGHNRGRWAMLAAFGRIFRRAGQINDVPISQDMVVEEANVSRSTAQRHWSWVVEQGWLIRVAGPSVEVRSASSPRQLATVWTIDPRKLMPPPGGERPTPQGGLTFRVGHDAFAERALGKNAYRVLVLALAGHDDAAIARQLGFHPATVHRHLDRLAERGLLTRQPSRRQLDRVAQDMGTAGRAARLREQHRQQRLDRLVHLRWFHEAARRKGKPCPSGWRLAA